MRHAGVLDAYLRDLCTATAEIMPSADGSPDHLCHFVIVILDPSGGVEIGTSIHDDRFKGELLKSIGEQILSGQGFHGRTVRAVPLEHAKRPTRLPRLPKEPPTEGGPRLWRAVPDGYVPPREDEGGNK
jgi:hypothetical protein